MTHSVTGYIRKTGMQAATGLLRRRLPAVFARLTFVAASLAVAMTALFLWRYQAGRRSGQPSAGPARLRRALGDHRRPLRLDDARRRNRHLATTCSRTPCTRSRRLELGRPDVVIDDGCGGRHASCSRGGGALRRRPDTSADRRGGPVQRGDGRCAAPTADVEFLSWTRPYPPLLYRGPVRDERSQPPHVEPAEFLLDWADPRTWRRALDRAVAFGAEALVLPVGASGDGAAVRLAPPRRARALPADRGLPQRAAARERAVRRPARAAVLGEARRASSRMRPAQRGELAGARRAGERRRGVPPAVRPRRPGRRADAGGGRRGTRAARQSRSSAPARLRRGPPVQGRRPRARGARAGRSPRSTCASSSPAASGRRGPSSRRSPARSASPIASSSATATSRTRRRRCSSPPATRRCCPTAARRSRASSRSRWVTAGR